eukprot:1359716-Amorphochlora_amoeboformis.AAC.1
MQISCRRGKVRSVHMRLSGQNLYPLSLIEQERARKSKKERKRARKNKKERERARKREGERVESCRRGKIVHMQNLYPLSL